ncbi:hypothetical protein METBIDRAFT_32181 [Metschnikowia bicuspidata var. bicuspidata NRRL YB-4993]|uniref:Uncharacterized protein n=1 Tax=Metschnikowia bicuspidata var. bicuspidata NRRL YB-4993 TaxID=869754 RepID=A0A1A0HCU3_9ASCO|nr:hypothetical protein METBIDRAFT_32181 [Metschnikowia bicuspidata var. bicuspidata NRRL YB-4993]OBA21712.1 hypothetical protein METBIDRAFT_32181 [Metschnikowia bicuspidata var. bicuspidata NRRL YB-4993]
MGLSSNVMNMKFMQKAQNSKKNDLHELETKKIRDLSEWLLPSGTVKPKIKPAVTVRTVGYGSIASLTAKENDAISNDNPKSQTAPPSNEPEKTRKDDAQTLLNEILDKAQKDQKRLQKQSKQLRKKARKLLS